MSLPNNYFENFPIDFKRIDVTDFPDSDVRKKIIKPDNEGYIFDTLRKEIDLEEKNTVVINASVGQGKTYSIIDIVKQYFKKEDYVIFIASPFVSLVQQYYNEVLEAGISEDNVFRYEELGNKPTLDYLVKKVQIVTVNCLLGNPGENAFINSVAKRIYLNKMSDYCERGNKKVVFIYDEIHDAIHNFREKYIFNLWKWKQSIHKNFIVSATYNEASKSVIEYLSELTENKIQIIESEREVFPDKQSDLFLHYNPAYHYKNTNEGIIKIFEDLIKRDKEIDVLCYSKALAESIIEEKTVGIGRELYKKYGELNNCTSELIVNQRKDRVEPANRYDGNKCNVGTNFTSGVSIKKHNHAYVIIMPPRGTKMPFQNLYGIFSRGINSIIQSLARQRIKGEIHIVLPRPDRLDYNSLPFMGECKDVFENYYNAVRYHKEPESIVRYFSLDKQKKMLDDFYSKDLRANVEKEIDIASAAERRSTLKLEFPDFKTFVLEDGEDYLANEVPFWGGDLASYVTYNAFTNQFTNCRLKGISIKPILLFTEGIIQKCFDAYYEMYFLENYHHSKYIYLNDFMFYKEFRDDIYSAYDLRMQLKGKWHRVSNGGTNSASKIFEIQLLGFVQRLLNSNQKYNKSLFYTEEGELIDADYTLGMYLTHCISQSRYIDTNNVETVGVYKRRVEAFKFLNLFRRRLIRLAQTGSSKNRGVFKYLLNKKPPIGFIKAGEVDMFNRMINYFLKEDLCLKVVYGLFSRLNNKAFEKQVETIYRVIIESFFVTEDEKLSTGRRPNVKVIISVNKIPYYGNVIDFVSSPEYNFSDNFLESITLSKEELDKLFS